MDRERLQISAQVYWVRARSHLKTVVRLAALAVVLLGMFNLFATAIADISAIRPYPTIQPIGAERGVFYLGDVIAIGAGAVLAWVV